VPKLATGDHVELYLGADGWRWRAYAKNGRILADSGQGYSRRIDALNGARRALRIGFAYARIGNVIRGYRLHATTPISPPQSPGHARSPSFARRRLRT
jgi:uncharacterized protein YegP (UPF0339 family)